MPLQEQQEVQRDGTQENEIQQEPLTNDDSTRLETSPVLSTLSDDEDDEEKKPRVTTPSPRRNGRRRKTNSKYQGDEWINYIFEELPSYNLPYHEAFLLESDLNTKTKDLTTEFDLLHSFKKDDNDEDIIHRLHHFAFAARANAEDTPHFNEAMSYSDREGFIEAMRAELDQLTSVKEIES